MLRRKEWGWEKTKLGLGLGSVGSHIDYLANLARTLDLLSDVVGASGSARRRGFDFDFELWKGQPSHTEKSRSGKIVAEELRRELSEHGD